MDSRRRPKSSVKELSKSEGQLPSAEVGEGWAQTEENIVQSHMRPTQSGKRMSQGLHGVRQAIRSAAPDPRYEPYA